MHRTVTNPSSYSLQAISAHQAHNYIAYTYYNQEHISLLWCSVFFKNTCIGLLFLNWWHTGNKLTQVIEHVYDFVLTSYCFNIARLTHKIIDIREEIDRKSQALNTRMRVPQFTYLRSPINNLSHVTKNVGFM